MADIEERREATEFRTEGRKLVGYAATFGVRTTVADFTEVVSKGAFKASLDSRQDVVALVDHDRGRLLARTRSGTLRLSEDDIGLRFEIDLPDTQLGRDTLALVERGDIGGASFAFLVPKGGDSWQGRERTINNVKLVDVSIVSAFPAYPQTSVAARSKAEPKVPVALAKRFIETW